MKNILSFIIIIITLGKMGFSQTDTIWNITDSKGLKQGYWKNFYSNGKVRYKGYFKDDKPAGEFRRYYDNGSLMAIQNYITPEISYVKWYYQNGLLAAEGKYVGKEKDSLWRFYSYYDKSLRLEEYYIKGKKNGKSVKYYANRRPAEIIHWSDDKKNGEWIQYFENGNIKIEGYYVNDERNGYYRQYRPDGSPEVFGYYKNNLMDGQWIYFDNKGQGIINIRYNRGIALNPQVLDSIQQEFIRSIDENKGKYTEPSEEDFIPMLK